MNRRRIIGASRPSKKDNNKKIDQKLADEKKRKKAKKEATNNRYLIRSRIAAQRKATRQSRTEVALAKVENKYVVSKNTAKRHVAKKSKGESNKIITPAKIVSSVPMYSGTIIFNGGKMTLHPYKWTPEDGQNSPSHYKWETLLPGTHVLDQKTCLTWIVNKKRGLNLAPCQTIRLDMSVPDDITEFNPGLSLSPYLPEIKEIPPGTRFIFGDSNQVYVMDEDFRLRPMTMPESSRPSQVIPVPMNSLFNTQRLWGLGTPVINSELQNPTASDGYTTLQDWFGGLIQGTDSRPGFLGDLPKVDQLQPYDVIEFYDPNLKQNPRINNMNPDGTTYVEGLHESKFFNFRLQIYMDEKNRLTGREITQPASPFLCNISVPIEPTNQDRPIYIRSAALIPHLGDPIVVLNEIERPYYLDSELDSDRLLEDFLTGLLKIGYPYQQIRVSYIGESDNFYVIRFSNLPCHLWGVVLASDNMPLNKYAGSGRFFLGYSANSQGATYQCELDTDDDTAIRLDLLNVHDVTVDGILVKLDDLGDKSGVISLGGNRQVGQLLNRLNTKLGGIGYPGYVLNMWWNEAEYKLKFYLSGVINNHLPGIMMNINNNLVALDFVI